MNSASSVIASVNNPSVSEAYLPLSNNSNLTSNEFAVTSSPPKSFDVNSYSSASMQPVEAAYLDDNARYSLSNEIPSTAAVAQIDEPTKGVNDETLENYYNDQQPGKKRKIHFTPHHSFNTFQTTFIYHFSLYPSPTDYNSIPIYLLSLFDVEYINYNIQ